MNIPGTENIKPYGCACGREHTCKLDDVIIGSGAIEQLPQSIKHFGAKKAFILSDLTTHEVAGKFVCDIIKKSGFVAVNCVINEASPKPHEHTVGSVMLNFDRSCDIVVAVGSGVINDCAKILANAANLPYIIVATAPSMDGYASASSSMERGGVKVSIPTKNADIIIGDTDILKNAPMKMLYAGFGDIIAKYTALCDWRIANIVVGDTYCEDIAQMIRTVLAQCVDNAEGLVSRDAVAVEAVFRAMLLGGVAMSYAGTSQVASGVEHSLSHIWDMRALEFGTASELHGLQCAVGTFIGINKYEKLRQYTPNREKALEHAARFDYEAWSGTLLKFIGKGAEAMIKLEKAEKKYDLAKHEARLDTIIKSWDSICAVMDEELPDLAELEQLFAKIGAPVTMRDIGIDESTLELAYSATRDIRDKYIQSRLVWDLGVEI